MKRAVAVNVDIDEAGNPTLLVAAIGVATVNYVAVACTPTMPPTSGNLPAPPPFDAGAPSCAAPPGLQKILAFAQDNERQFMQGVAHGLSLAAKDRGLEYRVALANNDPKKMIEQVQLFLNLKVGAVVAAPVNPLSLSRSLQQVIWAGGFVGTLQTGTTVAATPEPGTFAIGGVMLVLGGMLRRSRHKSEE